MKRFESLQINDRPVALALFRYEDHFYDAALRRYDFKSALHLYLKQNGYSTIIFFSIDKGLHSFEKEMLASFVNNDVQPEIRPTRVQQWQQKGRTSGHFGAQLQSQIGICDTNEKVDSVQWDNDGFWVAIKCNARDSQMRRIRYNLLVKQHCIIVIEPSDSHPEFVATSSGDQKGYLGEVIACLQNENVKENDNHFVIIAETTISTGYSLPSKIDPNNYGTDHSESNFWKDAKLLSCFLDSKKDDNGRLHYSLKDVEKPYGPVWVLPPPTNIDCKNAFQYWRIIDRMSLSIQWGQTDDIMSQISHVRGKEKDEQPKSLEEWRIIFNTFNNFSYPAFDAKYGIKNRNGNKAQKKLEEMCGIETIRSQFQEYCERLSIERKNSESKFRPHMAFLGSPGTGKTTTARLFAEILKDKGLLSVGHLVQVSSGELIGEHIGETRPKAAKVCESAIGGVLFIDEAYGLHREANEGTNGNTFGDEAIDVIIQYMENYKDNLIVIFAGYTDETRYMINHGNPGLPGRFDDDCGYYYFTPYAPDVLFDMVMFKITKEGWNVTEDFRTALKNIILIEHSLGQTLESNARYAEQIAGNILSRYKNRKVQMGSTLNKNHIPESKRKLIDPSLIDQSIVFNEINQLVGQEHLKKTLKEIYTSCAVQMTKASKIPNYTLQLPQLGFVIMGPSGTGKTTFAHAIANILFHLGLMSGNNGTFFTSTTGVDILQKGISAAALLKENLGKTLFIDEAYGLTESKRFVDDLVGEMQKKEFKNKLCIILAGYEKDIKILMAMNQGLPNRFPSNGRFILMDYSNEDLAEMLFRRQDEKIRFSEDCRPVAVDYFFKKREEKKVAKDPSNPFGNAREVETLLRILESARDNRYYSASEEQQRDPIFASLIIPEDFPNYQGWHEEHDVQFGN